MKFLLGTKDRMTQIFGEDGSVVPVTEVTAGPMTVVQIKTKEKDGYDAVQFGFGDKKAKNIKKPLKGHIGDLGNFRYLRELRLSEKSKGESPKRGDKIDASVFAPGDKVEVSGITKGKGFQGVVKRHGFKGGPRSHGQKHSEREAGSIGATWPQRVLKGKRMAGRMGSDRVMVKNLKIVAIDAANNKIMVSGALPGRKGTLLELRSK